MKKILNFFALLCVLNILTAGGLVAYLFATGRLDGEKSRAIVDLVRHRGTPPKIREQLYDILEATPATAASQPSTLPADEAAGPHASSAQERIAFARQAMEQERLALENQAQDLRHRQELLVKLQSDLQDKLDKIIAAKKESEPKAATAESKTREENFQKSLDLYNELKPKQVKDIFFGDKNVELTAKYLTAMDPSDAGKIIGEFKSPPEQTFIASVLERIRLDGTANALVKNTPGDTAPASPGTVPAPAGGGGGAAAP